MNATSLEPCFWMGGQLATELVEVIDDPAKIDDGFWAITASFSGKFTAAKFKRIERVEWPYPYRPLQSKNWVSSHDKRSYCELVEHFRDEIALGNIYQVNACRILTNHTDESIAGLLTGFLANNPAKYAGYLKLPGLEIASASPETFIERSEELIYSAPIKGTRRSGMSGPFPEKDQSENVMIVDLMRNDFGRITIEDTVTVPKLLETVELPGLAHLVSEISGKLKPGISWPQIFQATFPPGSVSGAPKSSAINLIQKYEAIDRGPYCGAFGWINGGRASLAVAIRTFWSDGESVKFGTGAGITWASVASDEWDETQLKAKRLIAIANGEYQ